MSPLQDHEPMDDRLRSLLHDAVDDVPATRDLPGVLAGVPRGSRGHQAEPSPWGHGRGSGVRRPLVAVAAAAAAAASIFGIVAGIEQLSPDPARPPVATQGPAPTPADPEPGTPQPAGGSADPLAPVRDGEGRWLVPVYRMMLDGSVGGSPGRSYFLEAELAAVPSDGGTRSLLAAALTANLTGSVSDYGTTVLGDLEVLDVEETAEGFTVTVAADGLAPGIPDREGVLEAALQQAAWTARSMLGRDVLLSAELRDQDRTVEVTPDPAALGTWQVAQPVTGATYEVGGTFPITGTAPAATTELTYELFRTTPIRGGVSTDLVDSGDVAYGEATDALAGRRPYAIEVPVPDEPGSYELTLAWFGGERVGSQDLGHTFEVVARD